MNVGTTMSRSLFRLYASYLESQVVEEVLPLNVFFLVARWVTAQKFPWDGEAFAEDQVSW